MHEASLVDTNTAINEFRSWLNGALLQKGVEESCARILLTHDPCFCKYRKMTNASSADQVTRFADMFSAMGVEPRLRIMQLLLSAYPDGVVVSDIQSALDIPNSTLSHHLDKLKNEDLVLVHREGTFLRYRANTESLQQLLRFLYAECCTRNKAVKPQAIIQVCK